MATKKPKTSTKSAKTKSAKPKTAAKTAVKTEIEAPKTNTVEKKSGFKGFFARRYEGKEGVMTVFKTPKFYGALLGEVIGTLLLTMIIFSVFLLGPANIATYAFALIAILIAVFAFSGACLNPIVVAGLMATRNMSVIRGVMYIVAEVLGAWLGWLIFNGFHLAGGDGAMVGTPAMAEVAENGFWPMAMVEIMGAIMIAFFATRALKYKRSAFTYAAVFAGGIALAYVVGYVVSAAFLGFQQGNNFVMNPAMALMLQIFPTAGEDFGQVFGIIMQALSLYVFLPMIAGVVGSYIAEFTSTLSEE
ncbi:aquaporin [Candidatus Saccharibacteria bacterium]|nr:aquaporin [Candidatus Saccharibacteria bacterium]